MRNQLRVSMCVIAVLILIGCSPEGPEPIKFGTDQCHYCKMTISNPKYGAELITKKGRIHKYDAVECVVNQLSEENIEHSGIYAIAYDNPKELKPVDSLHFVISKDFRSPMGANLAAFSDRGNLSEDLRQKTFEWSKLRKKFDQ